MTSSKCQQLLYVLMSGFLMLAAALSGAAWAEVDVPLETIIASSRERTVLVSTQKSSEGQSLMDTLAAPKHYCCAGVIIESNRVLTNAHVLHAGDEIYVDGRRATIIKRSKEDDMLLLSVQTRHFPRLKLKERVASAERAFYIGNPRYHRASVFIGNVVRVDGKFVYSDCFKGVGAAMGASGSGLYSLDGELIGLKKGMLPSVNGAPPLSVAVPAIKIRQFLK